MKECIFKNVYILSLWNFITSFFLLRTLIFISPTFYNDNGTTDEKNIGAPNFDARIFFITHCKVLFLIFWYHFFASFLVFKLNIYCNGCCSFLLFKAIAKKISFTFCFKNNWKSHNFKKINTKIKQ